MPLALQGDGYVASHDLAKLVLPDAGQEGAVEEGIALVQRAGERYQHTKSAVVRPPLVGDGPLGLALVAILGSTVRKSPSP